MRDQILAILPGATIWPERDGYSIGGFSMPQRDALEALRRAGIDARNRYGQTFVPLEVDRDA